jgi:hypothetical protein
MNTDLIKSIADDARMVSMRLYTEIETAKRNADRCVQLAWELGDLCIRAKAEVCATGFAIWLDGTAIDPAMLAAAIKLRSTHEAVDDATRRQGYLTLLVPDKERVEHEGNVQLCPPSHHNSIVNAWSKWQRRVEIGKLPIDKDRARRDMRGLFDWLKGLYEEA